MSHNKTYQIQFAVSMNPEMAVLVSAPEEMKSIMDGVHLCDNSFKGCPTVPGLYSADAEFWFQQGYSDGYLADGESDWEFLLTNVQPIAPAPVPFTTPAPPVPLDALALVDAYRRSIIVSQTIPSHTNFGAEHDAKTRLLSAYRPQTLPAAQVPEWWPECPYPESVFPMTTKEVAAIIPEDKITGVSGYYGRLFWNIAAKSIFDSWKFNRDFGGAAHEADTREARHDQG